MTEVLLWVAALGFAWWYLQLWPFHGSSVLPGRKAAPPAPGA